MTVSSTARIPLRIVIDRSDKSRVDPFATSTDEELLELIRTGDQTAFACLFRRYAHQVRSIALRVLEARTEADDLLQDVFLYIHQNCRTYDRSKGAARGWVLQIAHHRAIDRRRYLESRRFYKNEDLEETTAELVNSTNGESVYESSLEGVLGREESRRLFKNLSLDQKETIRLAFFDGYTFEEIAKLRGQSFGAVRNQYYRGLERIRRQLFVKASSKT